MFLVEDELSILELYEMILSISGFEVIGTAKNGEEAVQMYKSFPKRPDVIIMDHRMPIKSGIEASKEILEILKVKAEEGWNGVKRLCQRNINM